MERYDSYKDSGIEWIGEIPSSWTIPKMSYLLEGITDGTHGTHERVDEGELFLSSKNVTNKGIFIGENESKVTTEEHEKIVKKGYPVKGDILITVVGSIGRSCVYEYDYPISFQRSVCFLRFKETVNEYFMNFLIHSDVIQFQLLKNTKKSTQGGIYMNDLKRFDINLPPLLEQQQIVSFLDTKTSLIDSLIEKTQRKIELLKEKRTSLINELVTKGLNPNVEMKDSGVEWIGKIPSHWIKTKVKYISDIVRGSILRPVDEPLYFDENGEWTYLNISDVSKVEKFLTYGKLRLSELGSTKSRRVEPNNLIITGSGTVGKVFINTIPVCVHDGFIPLLNLKVNINFMFFYLINPNLYVGIGKTNSQKNIYLDEVKEMDISIPSDTEQQQIVEYLDKQTQLIDNTISIEEKRIELLKEYRQSLISEVVTGKRKVV